MQTKNFYTLPELKKSNTSRLISIYNRIFKLNIWEEYFNPFEQRQMIILTIWAEMQALEIALLSPADVDTEPKRYSAVKLIVTPNGWAIIWQGVHAKQATNKRAISDDSIRLMRNLRQDGESYVELEAIFGMKASMVGKICRGERFAEVHNGGLCGWGF